MREGEKPPNPIGTSESSRSQSRIVLICPVAWEVIRFLLSERMGQISARLGESFYIRPYVFARSKYPVWKGDPDYAVFYGLRSAPEPEHPLEGSAQEAFAASFRELFNQELEAVLRDEKTEEEALNRIESEGNALLTQWRNGG